MLNFDMAPAAAERRFWRALAMCLAVVLAICLVANILRPDTVPRELTLMLFGTLVALGVGYTIIDPRASMRRLSVTEEARRRHVQYVVGGGFGAALVLGLVFVPLPENTRTALLALFGPIILLTLVLPLREWLLRRVRRRRLAAHREGNRHR